MGLLQELPTKESFDDILAGIVGDAGAGTGVAGVLALLQTVDPPAVSASVAVDVGDGFSANVEIDIGATTSGPLAELERAAAEFPVDPAALVAPLADRLSGLRGITTGDIGAALTAGLDGLRGLESLSPPDTRPLVAGVTEGIEGLKAELLVGTFAELREWSTAISQIAAELEPLFAGGAGSLEDRLIGWLVGRLGELVTALLPDDLNLSLVALDPLSAALPTARLDAFGALRADLLVKLGAAQVELAAGNFTNLGALQAAADAFAVVTAEVADLVAGVKVVLDDAGRAPEALLRLLRERLLDLRDAEVIDLGNLRQRFAAGIKALEDKVRAIDLDGPMQEVGALFDRIDSAIDDLQLRQLSDKLTSLTDSIRASLDGLDSSIFEIVATLRNLFGRLKSTLDSVVSVLGSFDAEGNFHFHVQDQIESALQSARDAIDGTIRPLLEEFRETIGGVLGEVQSRLEGVRDQIEGAKDELRAALDGVSSRLAEVDVVAEMEGMRAELQRMLDELGRVDFDVVAEPVIGEINEMRDLLAGIDVSALGEVSIGALKVSVSVVVEIDFEGAITSMLMTEIDKLLELPKAGLEELEAKIEAAVQAFAALDPSVILAPLHEVFEPVESLLAEIEIEPLVKPIDDWYKSTTSALDALDPAVLLRPVIDVVADMEEAFARIAPATLIAPLQDLLEEVKGELRGFDFGGIEGSLNEAIATVRAFLEKVSPARLLTPLVELFDKVMAALDAFDPAVLLEPFTALFAELTGPLERLTAEHADAIALAFVPLRAIVDLLDPKTSLELVAGAASTIRAGLRTLDLGGLIAELQGPFEGLHASVQATGPGESSVSLQVDVLNPLRDPALTQAAADLQAVNARLDALIAAKPDPELEQLYAEVSAKLSGLVPSWAKPELTPDEIRQSFAQANPLALGDEIRALWQAFKDKIAGFSPKIVQDRLQVSYDHLLDTILGLEPSVLLAPVRATLDEMAGKLDAIDPGIVLAELTDASDEIAAVLHALDPTPVIEALQDIADDVKQVVAALNPAEVLGELEAPLEATKDIVREFDPASLAEPLQEVFEQIQGILVQVDVGVVLEPLNAKLEELRSDLRAALERVEAAFNGMISAIPVAA